MNWPAHYYVFVGYPANSPFPKHGSTGEHYIKVWAHTAVEARKLAVEQLHGVTDHYIRNIERWS